MMDASEIKIGTWYTTGRGRFRKPTGERMRDDMRFGTVQYVEVSERVRKGVVVRMEALRNVVQGLPMALSSGFRSFAMWAVREATPEEAARCEEALK